MLDTPIQIQGAFQVTLMILKSHIKKLSKNHENDEFSHHLHGLIRNAFVQAVHLNEAFFKVTQHHKTYEANKIKIATIIKAYRPPAPTPTKP